MRRCILIPAFFVFGALIFHPVPARAGMHFCNKTSNTVTVAMATLTGDFFPDAHVWGWWQIAPDSCKTPIGADLNTTGDLSYYYYARDTAGGTWTGDAKFCVDTVNAFDYNDKEDMDCTTGTNRSFKTISTHDETDFTVNLTL